MDCGVEKDADEFSPCKGRVNGRRGACRACERAKERARDSGKPSRPRPRSKQEWKAEWARKALESGRWYEIRGVRFRRVDRLRRGAEIRKARRVYERRRALADAAAAKRKARESRPSAAEVYRERYKSDPEFALRERIRASMRRTRNGYKIGDTLRGALKRGGRTRSLEEFLGYTIGELKRHLERQFRDGMSWEAFHSGEIHIDHIVPLSSFDVSDADNLRAAWQLTNLRPLWARENLAKKAKRLFLL